MTAPTEASEKQPPTELTPEVQAAALAALEARKEQIGPWIDRAHELCMHLMALKPGLKEPANGSTGWPDLKPPTGDQAEAWMLKDGGNLGCNLGRSQMILWDADNAPGAQALLDAGYRPWAIPANAQNPNHSKGRFDGRHFLWRRPKAWNVKDDDLTGGQVRLPNGGTIDVLCGRHYFVLPPSVLCEEEYVATYRDANAIGWDEDIDELPMWAWPDEFRPADAPEPPPGLEALRGAARRKTATEKVEQDARSNELSEAVDAISWDEWLAGETRLSDDSPASCGCDRKKWYASSNPGSVALHDCWLGKFARIHSDTMAFELDADQRSMSALSLHALLNRQSVRESARQRGIDMGSEFGFAEALDNAADLFEAHAEDGITATVLQLFPAEPRQKVGGRGGISFLTASMAQVHADSDYWAREAAGCRGLARQLRGGTSALPQNGPEVFGAPQVMGAPPQVPNQTAPPGTGPIDVEVVEESPAETPNTPVVDDAIDGEFVEDDDEWVIRGADAITRIRELEEKLKGARNPHTGLWTGMTPGLGRIANLAESRGVFMAGLTGAIMPRVAARIPANVIIEPEHGVCENKVEGVGFSHSALLIGPSATGKTKTEITAAAAVPMLPGIAEIPSGTAEGIVKEARSWESTGKGRGKVEVHTTSVFVQADEVGTVKAEVQRDASKYASFICSATMGNTIVGQIASDKARKAAWPPHSTRLAQSIGAQPHKCGFLLDDAGSGAGARFDWVPVGSVDPAERGPLYGTPVPPVLVNGKLPWDPPVGIPFGYRPYTGAAPTGDGEEDVPLFEVDPAESLPAEWVHFPEGVLDSAGSAQMAADRSANWREAIRTDRALGRVAAHDTLMVQKQATYIAALDGLKQPELVHWQAALVLAEIREITVAETKVIADDEGDEESRKKGRGRGIEYATGNAVGKHETQSAIERTAAAIYKKLTAEPEGDENGKNCGFGGEARRGQLGGGALTASLRPFRDDGIALLMQLGKVDVFGTGGNTDTVRVRPAIQPPVQLAAAPPISKIA